MAPRWDERRWDALATEVLVGLKEWRLQHPKATFKELEQAWDERLSRLRARMLQDVAVASAAADVRAQSPGERPVCPTCGGTLEARGQDTRGVTTTHGQAVTLPRSSLVCAACGASVFHLDEELQLWPGECSPTLAEGAAHLGASVPFERLPDLLRRFTGTLVAASTVQRVTATAGAATVALQTQAVARLEREVPPPPAGPAVLQLRVDGAMVPLRGKGEWAAEVKTLAVGGGEVQPAVVNAQGEREVPVTGLSYFSRLTDAETFGRLATVETHRRGGETAGLVGAVVDGAAWCQGVIDLHRPDAVRILDFPHAAEYLAQVAQVGLGAGTPAATQWLATQGHTFKHDAPGPVLDAVRAVRDTVASTTIPRRWPWWSPVWPTWRSVRRSWPTPPSRRRACPSAVASSGIVESANRVVVEARLKGAGMH